MNKGISEITLFRQRFDTTVEIGTRLGPPCGDYSSTHCTEMNHNALFITTGTILFQKSPSVVPDLPDFRGGMFLILLGRQTKKIQTWCTHKFWKKKQQKGKVSILQAVSFPGLLILYCAILRNRMGESKKRRADACARTYVRYRCTH